VLDSLDRQMRQGESELSRLKENVAKVAELKKVKNSRMALLGKYIEKIFSVYLNYSLLYFNGSVS